MQRTRCAQTCLAPDGALSTQGARAGWGSAQQEHIDVGALDHFNMHVVSLKVAFGIDAVDLEPVQPLVVRDDGLIPLDDADNAAGSISNRKPVHMARRIRQLPARMNSGELAPTMAGTSWR